MKCSEGISTCGRKKWKVRWICEFTWECSSSKVKFKTNWCYYLTALEEKNYMPIRKYRCYKNLWIIALFKGESLESRNSLY